MGWAVRLERELPNQAVVDRLPTPRGCRSCVSGMFHQLENCPAHPARTLDCPAHWIAPHTFSGLEGVYPNHLFWRSEWVLVAVAAAKTRRRLARTSERTGPGAGSFLEPSLGYDRSRIPVMAYSQGDVRSSPMAYPAVRPLPKLPLLLVSIYGQPRDADYLLDDYVFDQNRLSTILRYRPPVTRFCSHSTAIFTILPGIVRTTPWRSGWGA